MSKVDKLAVNTIRVLSAEAIQKANSGHPGLPQGYAGRLTEYHLYPDYQGCSVDSRRIGIRPHVGCCFRRCRDRSPVRSQLHARNPH